MKTGIYKNEHGHELNVVEIDEEGRRVRVDYGNNHSHWWNEADYLAWESPEPKEEIVNQQKDEVSVPQETIEPPPAEAKPKAKRAIKKKK